MTNLYLTISFTFKNYIVFTDKQNDNSELNILLKCLLQ